MIFAIKKSWIKTSSRSGIIKKFMVLASLAQNAKGRLTNRISIEIPKFKNAKLVSNNAKDVAQKRM